MFRVVPIYFWSYAWTSQTGICRFTCGLQQFPGCSASLWPAFRWNVLYCWVDSQHHTASVDSTACLCLHAAMCSAFSLAMTNTGGPPQDRNMRASGQYWETVVWSSVSGPDLGPFIAPRSLSPSRPREQSSSNWGRHLPLGSTSRGSGLASIVVIQEMFGSRDPGFWKALLDLEILQLLWDMTLSGRPKWSVTNGPANCGTYCCAVRLCCTGVGGC
jgi:hypothetical protein